MDVIVIGTVVTDVIAGPIASQDSWLEKQRISGITLSTGGDGANQSIRLGDLGRSVSIAACIGKDQAGTLAKAALASRGVDVSHIVEKAEYETGTSLLLLRPDGEQNAFSNAGAHGMLTKEDCAWVFGKDMAVSGPEAPRALSIASLFSLPLLEDDGLLELLRTAKTRGILTFADLGSDKRHLGLTGIRPFLPLLDYFLPSEDGALRMTGASTPEEAASTFFSCGASNVVIKCAERGACYTSAGSDSSGWVPAIPVQPVDTTGAGDCFAAHLIHGILSGLSLRDACASACKAASLSTLNRGASLTPLDKEALARYQEKT